ncbi:MAG: peptidoglycan recognition family protein [Armatimonadota bacterium]|nr:peptidoglycan recognition family protein [Armatimonadota bacterium]
MGCALWSRLSEASIDDLPKVHLIGYNEARSSGFIIFIPGAEMLARAVYFGLFCFFLFYFSITLAFPITHIPEPPIVSKEVWGSMCEGDFWQDHPYDPYSQGIMGDPVAITIHHTYRPLGTNPPDPAQDRQKLIDIQRFHVGKGWGDIGYHFLIGSDGTIYEGRPLGYTGTHAPPNYGNIGVNVIGDFHEAEYPSNLQLESLVRLLSWLCDKFDIDPTSKITLFEQSNLAVAGHRDWNATACPGDRLYCLLPQIREQVRARLLSGQPYDARIAVTQFLLPTLLAKHVYELPFTVRNTGYVEWSHLNLVGLESATPEIASVSEPVLMSPETVGPLGNRQWKVTIKAPEKAGTFRIALQMVESNRHFGPELGWSALVLAPEDFISSWLVAGPYPAETPDKAFAKDFLAGEPLDLLEVMDPASEVAHAYRVDGEYDNGEGNYRGEDGERFKESGRYFRGEESFRLFLDKYRGGDLVLRKLINAGVRDQRAEVYIGDRRFTFWRTHGSERFRRWKEIDLVIPAYKAAGKKSLDVRLKVLGTKQWGCNSFRYMLLDKAESLAAPKPNDKGWFAWKSGAGLTDLSSVIKGVDNGAVYLAVYVKSPQTRWVQLRTGYGGRLKAWLNGEQAIATAGGFGDFPDTAIAEVLLRRGWNRLLVKVVLEPGKKDLYVRLSDRQGNPLEGLKLALEPSDKSAELWIASNR